ncbi:MAG: LytTR family DNA-binding domain-containing protein [Flavobacteriaceae bacterium]|nr:LytTR family DNA-binding domain-containing protein [Flavobacteriaceae bacterium]
MKYSYIIVEDNPGALKNLQSALKSFTDFRENGVENTMTGGVSLALKSRPHIIFLDVQLGEENGFDLIKEVRQFSTELPFIIMTTDFDKYAKKAVNSDVLYFLDKPIDPDELVIALHKFEKKFLELRNHITIKNSEGHYFMQLEEILYIKSNDNCCQIYKQDGSRMFVTKTLKQMDSILPLPFLRIHKSYIVNTQFVHMLNTRKKRLQLKFADLADFQTVFPISDLYMEKVKQTLLVENRI